MLTPFLRLSVLIFLRRWPYGRLFKKLVTLFRIHHALLPRLLRDLPLAATDSLLHNLAILLNDCRAAYSFHTAPENLPYHLLNSPCLHFLTYSVHYCIALVQHNNLLASHVQHNNLRTPHVQHNKLLSTRVQHAIPIYYADLRHLADLRFSYLQHRFASSHASNSHNLSFSYVLSSHYCSINIRSSDRLRRSDNDARIF